MSEQAQEPQKEGVTEAQLLKQALQAIADARDYLIALRAALHSLPFLPIDQGISTALALHKLADQMTMSIAEKEQLLLSAQRDQASTLH